MASLRSNMVMAAAVAAILVLMSSSTLVSGQSWCLDASTPLVYPLWSYCLSPALYHGDEVYEIQGSGGGRLAPEWDSSNSTYYVREAEEGAKYLFTYLSSQAKRSYVAQSDDVVVMNMETERILSWRAEGENEYFLVEEEEETGNATLQFAVTSSQLPCPLLVGARCSSYFLLDFNNNASGLSPYVENDVTYFTLGTDTTPFVLLRSNSTTLKSVVA